MLIQDKRKYPPYEHQEYPKWVKDKEGKKILVHTQEEEESLAVIEVDDEPEERSERSRRKKG